MVVHQHVGMQLAVGRRQGICQQGQVAPPVVIAQEAGKPVVAPLDDVKRTPGMSKRGSLAMRPASGLVEGRPIGRRLVGG